MDEHIQSVEDECDSENDTHVHNEAEDEESESNEESEEQSEEESEASEENSDIEEDGILDEFYDTCSTRADISTHEIGVFSEYCDEASESERSEFLGDSEQRKKLLEVHSKEIKEDEEAWLVDKTEPEETLVDFYRDALETTNNQSYSDLLPDEQVEEMYTSFDFRVTLQIFRRRK